MPEAMNQSERRAHRWFLLKMVLLLVLCICDLAINSSVEFEDLIGNMKTGNRDVESEENDLLTIAVAVHIIILISAFLTLFLMMGDTYLFRVGLLGVLARQFAWTLALHPFYLLYTILLSMYRVQSMQTGTLLNEIWDLPAYTPLSVIHKVIAAVYYVANLRAAIALGAPIYYSKDAWVNLYYSNRDTSAVTAASKKGEMATTTAKKRWAA
jgi:hypothetical protein